MGLEIELKMRAGDVQQLEAELNRLGAVCRDQVDESDTYFDTADHNLRRADQGLRLRCETVTGCTEQRHILTHKGPRCGGQVKTRRETQVRVEDRGATFELLEALGYRIVLSFEKRRRYWELDDCVISIDRLPLLGTFLEIEGPSRAAVLARRKQLQLDRTPLIDATYADLLCQYLKAHDLKLERITFDDPNPHTTPLPGAAR